jgi:GNAT superfamily N-acetyltransferase
MPARPEVPEQQENSLIMNYILKEVISTEDLMAFIRFPDRLYRDVTHYVPALHRGQRDTLSKEKNPAFEHCEARYWLALKDGRVAGRIAGIVNHRYNEERGTRLVRFGWLDFEEDPAVLRLLLQAVEDWGREKGMDGVHGPLGFTSFDPSGVLVEGFDEWPTSFGRYNFPYYDALLKEAGYRKDVDWVEYIIRVPSVMPEKVIQAARLIGQRYRVRQADIRSRKDALKYAGQIFELLNQVYAGLYAFSTLTPRQVDGLIREFITMIHHDYVSVVLNERDEVVAFGLVMPSLVRALKRSRGKLFPLGWLRILRALRYNDKVDMLLIGVRPDYQGKGVHSLVFDKIGRTYYKRGIRTIETTRELELNTRVNQLWAGYEPRQHKRARCYVRALSPEAPEAAAVAGTG